MHNFKLFPWAKQGTEKSWDFPQLVSKTTGLYVSFVWENSKQLLVLLLADLAEKKQRYSWTNQKPKPLRPFGTGPLKSCPQELFPSTLAFLPPTFFCRPFRFYPLPPVTALGSPRMSQLTWTENWHISSMTQITRTRIYFTRCSSR